MSHSAKARWSTPADLKAILRRRWVRGDLLADRVADGSLFPLRIPIKGPNSGEISSDFSSARDWIVGWHGQSAIPCEWKEFTHRLFGANQMPSAAVFPNAEAAIRLLGVRREWESFDVITERIRAGFPELLDWLFRRPMLALELAPDWDRLLAVVTWVRNHPHSGLYLRQIDAPGVHTKFVEQNRSTLSELLDLILPPDSITPDARGQAGFNRRYGFRDKPERIRLRFLDRACAVDPDRLGFDLTLDAGAFATLNPPVTRVFITENEINFLAFPNHPGSLVLFGAGYGWSALAQVDWLRNCAIHYWGDIDTHGFAILDNLRAHFPHVQSMLMDEETFETLRDFCTTEPEPTKRDLQRLTADERALFDLLRRDMNPTAHRLEQERIPYSMVSKALLHSLASVTPMVAAV
ncbi:MAG: hypothetical protein RLZZ282_108 [Verrucomicrobiota bacterium]